MPYRSALCSTWAIAICSLMQISQAIVMLGWPSGGGATDLLSTVRIFHLLDSPDGPHAVAAAMIFFSLLGLYGAVAPLGRIRGVLFVAQQIILGFQAAGGIDAMWLGAYLDGTSMITATHPGWPHIYNDQAGWFALFWIHIGAAICRCKNWG